jgi:hypothetical protein
MANPAKSKDWWANVANKSHEQHDMVRLSAGLHNLADSLYRPGAEADRPIRKTTELADRRLYQGPAKSTTKTKASSTATGTRVPAAGKPRTKATTSRKRSK